MDNSKEYKLMCLKSFEIQKQWEPQDGDFMVSKCSYCRESGCSEEVPCVNCLKMCNTFVISGHHHGHKLIGGDSWFFGGSPCNRNGGNLMNETHCFVMNESGKSIFSNEFYVSRKDKMLWLPRQDQIQNMFLNGCTIVKKIELLDNYILNANYNPHTITLEQLWLKYYMFYKFNKEWNETSNIKEWENIELQ